MAHNEFGRKVTGDQLPKSFSVSMGGTSVLTDEDRSEMERLKASREAEQKRIQEATQKHLQSIQSKKKTKKLIPYGTRLLVKRRKVEQTSTVILLPDDVAGLPTDIADVVAVPDQSLCDKELLSNSEQIIKGLSEKAKQGDAAAVKALFEFNEYLRMITLKPGDVLMIGKYIGTDFLIQETNQYLTVMDGSGIYAKVVEI